MSSPIEGNGSMMEDDNDADIPAIDGFVDHHQVTSSFEEEEEEEEEEQEETRRDEASHGEESQEPEDSHIAGVLAQEIEAAADLPKENGFFGQRYQVTHTLHDHSDDVFSDAYQTRSQSPVDSFTSLPDDTPSIRGSMLSSPGSQILPSRAIRPEFGSPTPSFRPFDRRFSSRLTPSSSVSRPSSPAFLKAHSRNTSLASQIVLNTDDADVTSPPWEVVRWSKLKKLNNQCFSEAARRNFGTPTCMTVSHSIVIGTSKGVILVFDVNQNLKSIIGPGTKAVESGAVTSVAISADYTTVAGGHSNGCIFTWDTARPAKPFLQVPALDASQLQNRTSDGHLPQATVTHLGFLGTRHTALVSANDRGMAFSHLATRGTGILGRSVKTTRILGRYPDDTSASARPRKASTVLAFASLPLGNVERSVDAFGLTAMLTPYLLVIVSTTPVAETQHKATRPKQVAAHSAMSGCLAWFPAVKLKVSDPTTGDSVSRVKLVYCWSNILTVLEIEEVESTDKEKPPSLNFRARSRWKAEEAIVAVQWLSRSVLCVLTITQRLIILEDKTMRMTEGFDLIGKHIFHADLFSKQLHALVEQLDEDDTSMHGVVADAFYMSFKAYKGKMFILGFNDVSVGAVSNWADRLIAMMENGDYIGAIALASSYYTGDADKLTIGLPEDESLRHSMVRDKIFEIMTASLQYAFGDNRIRGGEGSRHLRDLVEACFKAALGIGNTDYLFEEVYEWFEDGNASGIFLETLEPYILTREISLIPPNVVKALVDHYVDTGNQGRLEDMICQMETATLDLDGLTILCKRHHLYDALIYVWNQALGDYITPLVDLLSLLLPSTRTEEYFNSAAIDDTIKSVTALKVFPYLSYAFTGRRYPSGDTLDERDSFRAKSQLYWFLFSGNNVIWPPGSRKQFNTIGDGSNEPSFPYLRMILGFDAPSFLSVLNEAFEDPFLNDTPERTSQSGSALDMPEEEIFGMSINRQYVVSILIEVMARTDYGPEDLIYLDMFIARNLPKFPQYLLLSGSALHNILIGLCEYPGDDLADDAQLSVEYLLSIYHPSDLGTLIPLFRKAGFYRVLKSIYRIEKQYSELVQTYFEDPDDQEDVYDCLEDCLSTRRDLTEKQRAGILEVLRDHAMQLVDLDTARTAKSINVVAPALHGHFLHILEAEPHRQYEYLDAILGHTQSDSKQVKDRDFMERYVQLMCKYNPTHVNEFVNSLQLSDLRLDKVLPFMEDSGVVDAAVVLMARDGRIRDAMDRLIKHYESIEGALSGLLHSESYANGSVSYQTVEELLIGLQKYTTVGIWLCTGQGRTFRRTSGIKRESSSDKEALLPDELLWLDLIETTVQTTKNVSAALADHGQGALQNGHAVLHNGHDALVEQTNKYTQDQKIVTSLRSLVQQSFTALLNTTSPTQSTQQAPFLRILRAFLGRASLSSPSLSDLRAVLMSIFAAYTYERNILSLANRLIDQHLFVSVKEASELRQRGWRPKGSVCEACKMRLWGPGIGSSVYYSWQDNEERLARNREDKRLALTCAFRRDRGKGIETPVDNGLSIGKGKAVARGDDDDDDDDNDADDRETGHANDDEHIEELGAIVVLACRHIYHKSCLEQVQATMSDTHSSDGREFRCPLEV